METEFLDVSPSSELREFLYTEKPFTEDSPTHSIKNSFSISVNNFDVYIKDKKEGGLDTTPYLLIGFDTEYQSPESLVKYREDESDLVLEDEDILAYEKGVIDSRDKRKSGNLLNELLSYQTYCRIITPKYDEKGNYITSEGSGEDWECIVHPTSSQRSSRDGRLTLTELLYYTMAKGIEKYPNIKIPTNCYLLSHFSRADIPSLRDFEWDESDLVDGLMNIRGVYTGSKNINVNVVGDINLEIQLRDTINLAPAMKKKLLDIGKMLGFDKMTLGGGDKEDLYWKENMKEYMWKHYDEFKQYGILDAKITTEYAHQLIIINMKETGSNNLPRTLTSIATSKLIHMWKEEDWVVDKKQPELEICGRKIYTYKRFSNKTGKLTKVKKTDYVDKVKWRVDFVANTYHGGRNEQFVFGATWIDEWSDWDLRSAYATTMCMIGLPNWDTTKTIYDINALYKLEINDLAYAQVDFKFPESVRYPCLPVRGGESGLIFPLEGNSLCGLQELKLAKRLIDESEGDGYIRLQEGVYVETDKTKKVFQKFIQYCYRERNKAKLRKDSNGKTNSKNLFNYFWKEMSNSTYGKTAQGLRVRKIFDLSSMDVKPLPECQITQPFYASFITSMARASLAEIMNKLPRDKMVFSVTTDGFLTNASEDDIRKTQDGEICVALIKQIKELGDNTNILEVKHKVKQAIGWRTRGQGTLKEMEWVNESGEGDRENSIVLAKSGIKLNDRYEKWDENEKIVKYFFNREWNHKLLYKNLSGIREMTEYKIDLVDKPVMRNLSMEFDWKRKPSFTKDVKVDFHNKEYSHIYMETIPWKSIEDFSQLKDNLERFNSNNVKERVIKSVKDYQHLKGYIEGKSSLSKKNQAGLSKTKDSDVMRIKQQVLCAWRKRQGGTLTCLIDGKKIETNHIKYNQWEVIFKTIGIEVSKEDYWNSKTQPKEYMLFRIQNKKGNREMLDKLKEIHFPNLKISELLGNEDGYKLTSDEDEKTQFLNDKTRLFK